MPVAWYIVPYKIRADEAELIRYPAIDDYTRQIYANGGQWSETEVLGNRCIVKVRAAAAVLAALDSIYKRIPKDRLDDKLGTLSGAIKSALRNEILAAGYSLSEIQDRFGSDLGQYTLRDVLHFMASRRIEPRYDKSASSFVFDGPARPCRSIDEVDAEVSG
ncbi:MAG: hypothetical protein FOGNACKC_02232 [Anaerolineae bacterium]|nr:hypothetical protein [Anaerolineae bacterium]